MTARPTKTPKKKGLTGTETAFITGLLSSLQRPISAWRRPSPDEADPQKSRDWEFVRLPAGSVRPASVAPREILEQAFEAESAVGRVLPDGSGRVALRLGGRSQCAAVATVQASEIELAVNVFDCVAEWNRSTALVAELQEENESFASQLMSDLEELSFLRSIVDRLSGASLDEGIIEMAQNTLPVLNSTVRARCLAFLRLPDTNDPYTAEVAVKVGEHTLSDIILEKLVLTQGPSATHGPVIRNWSTNKLPEGTTLWSDPDCPAGVRSLVLAPLRSGQKQLGWLAAVNRAPTSEIGTESSWQLASDEFGSGEGSLIATTASILATQAANRDLLAEKEQLMVSMIRSLVSAIEAKDQYTSGHSERVALYTKRIAEEVGYFEEEADKLYLTALLHDVGKIGVSDAVLKKEGKLTDAEYAEIAKHPDEGWAILGDLDQLRYVLPGVLHHHERWDGRGYPDGLAGEAIPLDGRVMAVADAYDAMTSDRPYRKGMPVEKAEAILREGSGTQWDPRCIEAFFACLKDIHRIKAEYRQRPRPVRAARPPIEMTRELPHELVGIDE